MLALFMLIIGFVLLVKGANWLVTGSSSIAKKKNIPDIVIGLTIVAFGTSAPEMVVNSVASFQGNSTIVLSNIVGSNLFNTFLILGLVGVVFPITVQLNTIKKEIPISLLGTLIVLCFANFMIFGDDLTISFIEGLITLTLFVLFLYFIFKQMKKEPESIEPITIVTYSNRKIALLIIAGLAGLIIGGKLVVTNATALASGLGVSDKIIGLTIVAAGTSLPELVTSLVAAFKKNSDIAIGNVIGSNIFNILFVLPISALISPIAYNAAFNTEFYMILGGTLFLLVAMLTGRKKVLDRWEAVLLFIAYIVYTFLTLSN